MVTLRPAREDDLGLITHLYNDPDGAGSFDWYGWRNPGDWLRRWHADGLLGERDGTLVVATDSENVTGICNWRMNQTRQYCYSWSVGVAIDASFRTQGIGSCALNALVRYLFDVTPAHRIEAETDVENVAAQGILRNAKFTEEGRLRSYTFRDGEWRDSLVFGRLRHD